MLRNLVAIGVRLNRTPSEMAAMSVDDYALLMGHFQLEAQSTDRATASSLAQQKLNSMPKPRPRRR